jgi:hypothetical protein
LYWFQPRNPFTQPRYNELRDAEGHVVGTLRFLPKPTFQWGYTDRERAGADVGSSHWDLSIVREGFSGFFGLAATVLIDDGKTGIIKAGPYFSRGALALASGRQFRWKGSIFEGGYARFVDETGRLLVELHNGSYFTNVNGSVDVHPEAAGTSEWPLLVVLALYLRLLANRVWE